LIRRKRVIGVKASARALRGRRQSTAANFTHFSLTTAKDRNPAEETPTHQNFAGITAQ
jgi:hypothetical protein